MLYSVFWTKEIICGIWHICGQYLKLHKNAQSGIWTVWTLICVSSVLKLFSFCSQLSQAAFWPKLTSCYHHLSVIKYVWHQMTNRTKCLRTHSCEAQECRERVWKQKVHITAPETDICSFKRLFQSRLYSFPLIRFEKEIGALSVCF